MKATTNQGYVFGQVECLHLEKNGSYMSFADGRTFEFDGANFNPSVGDYVTCRESGGILDIRKVMNHEKYIIWDDNDANDYSQNEYDNTIFAIRTDLFPQEQPQPLFLNNSTWNYIVDGLGYRGELDIRHLDKFNKEVGWFLNCKVAEEVEGGYIVMHSGPSPLSLAKIVAPKGVLSVGEEYTIHIHDFDFEWNMASNLPVPTARFVDRTLCFVCWNNLMNS